MSTLPGLGNLGPEGAESGASFLGPSTPNAASIEGVCELGLALRVLGIAAVFQALVVVLFILIPLGSGVLKLVDSEGLQCWGDAHLSLLAVCRGWLAAFADGHGEAKLSAPVLTAGHPGQANVMAVLEDLLATFSPQKLRITEGTFEDLCSCGNDGVGVLEHGLHDITKLQGGVRKATGGVSNDDAGGVESKGATCGNIPGCWCRFAAHCTLCEPDPCAQQSTRPWQPSGHCLSSFHGPGAAAQPSPPQ